MHALRRHRRVSSPNGPAPERPGTSAVRRCPKLGVLTPDHSYLDQVVTPVRHNALGYKMKTTIDLPFGEQEVRSDGLDQRGVVERVDELLEIKYRSAGLESLADVLAQTVHLMLSRHSVDPRSRRMYHNLRERFPQWVDVGRADSNQLASVLEPGRGLGRSASELRLLLTHVEADNVKRGVGPALGRDLTLEYLRTEPQSAESFLTALPGVGAEFARWIAVHSLGITDLPLETHVARIFDRLGVVSAAPGKKPSHRDFHSAVPVAIRRRLHVNLVHHGRAVCRKTTPRCGDCSLVSFCEFGRARVAEDAGQQRAVDLFAGAGGMALGFRKAGFSVAVSVEFDRPAAQTYRLNHPGVPVLERDVTTVTGDILRSFAPASSSCIAVTVAGPPCQGYSAAGPRDPHAVRNYLYEHVIRIGKEVETAAVVIENVPGAAMVRGVEFADSIKRELQEQGFAAEKYLLEGPDFGVPQRRKRYFFIGIDAGLSTSPRAPRATHRHPGTTEGPVSQTLTLTQLLSQLPSRSHGDLNDAMQLSDGSTVYNAATMAHCERVVLKISKIKPGQGPLSYRRLDPVLATTIVAGHRALPVHPTLDRTISVREAALIQGFPLQFVFCGRRSQQPLQVANAVPPPLAFAVARELRQLLAEAYERQGSPGVEPLRNCTSCVITGGKEALEPFRVAAMIEDQVAAIA